MLNYFFFSFFRCSIYMREGGERNDDDACHMAVTCKYTSSRPCGMKREGAAHT